MTPTAISRQRHVAGGAEHAASRMAGGWGPSYRPIACPCSLVNKTTECSHVSPDCISIPSDCYSNCGQIAGHLPEFQTTVQWLRPPCYLPPWYWTAGQLLRSGAQSDRTAPPGGLCKLRGCTAWQMPCADPHNPSKHLLVTGHTHTAPAPSLPTPHTATRPAPTPSAVWHVARRDSRMPTTSHWHTWVLRPERCGLTSTRNGDDGSR